MAITTRRQDVKLEPADIESDSLKPVVVWAWAGGILFAIGAWVMVRWLFSADFARTPSGPTPVPTFMKVGIVIATVLGVVASVVIFYRFVFRPWRREGRLSADGLLILAMTGMVWIDPFAAGWGIPFAYNSWIPNRGSWTAGIPLITNPMAANLAEPPNHFYLWYPFLMVIAANAVMRLWKRRYPRTSNLRLAMVALGFMIAMDFVLEITLMRLGYYVYLYGPSKFTLFHDHYYRMPLFEPIGAALVFWIPAMLRYFKNDKGQTYVERGIDQVRVSTRSKTMLRFLALFAIVNLGYIATYEIPVIFLSQHTDEIPADIQRRSYFLNQMCGEGTGYACPSQGVPLPTRNSGHLNTDGEFVPGKVGYPGGVPFQRE